MKRRLHTFLRMMIAAMLCMSIAVSVHAQDWIGSGTAENPYQVSSQAHLAAIATKGLDKHYKLTAPITIDAWATSIDGFAGTFKGGGLVITMTKATTSLFGTIATGGTVEMLGVNAEINSTSGTNNVGGIAAINSGTIQYCYVEGTITHNSNQPGGIVGENKGTIQDCYSTASVTTTKDYAGGIAGCNNKGTIQRCYATGAISSIKAGGIAGYGNSDNTIQNCIALNTSIAGGEGASGAPFRIARSSGSTTFANNYASPIIRGTWNDKGYSEQNGGDLMKSRFIGKGANQGAFEGWTTTNWNFDSGNANLPTLQGFTTNQPVTTRRSTMIIDTINNEADFEAFRNAVNGGGSNYENETVTLTANITLTDWTTSIGNSSEYYFNGTFDGAGYTIDITGTVSLFSTIAEGGTVKNLGVTGNLTDNEYAAGGGIAVSNNGTIQHCFTSVNVTRTNKNAAGIAASNSGTIRNCYTTGTITGTNAGGIAASNGGTIRNCYTTGTITGTGNAGGIAGYNGTMMGTATLSACYATGTITGNKAGGIVGKGEWTGTIANCIALNTGGISGSGSSPAVGKVVGECTNTLTANYASPGIPGTWNNIGDGKIDGADLSDTNFTNVRDASKAFAGWPIGADDWDLTTANLPTLKVFKGAQPTSTITRASAMTKPLITSIATADDLKAFRDAVKAGGDYTGKTVKLTASFPVTGWTEGIGGWTTSFTGTFDGGGNVITLTGATASLFGVIGTGATVKNLGVTGSVNTSSGAGGIAADNSGTIQNCFTSADVTSMGADASVGGIAGDNAGKIQNCYATGTITSAGNAGGIAGSNGSVGAPPTLSACYATGTITGNKAGGIVGRNGMGGKTEKCIALNTGGISGSGTTPEVGRIAANNEQGTLTANYASPGIPGTWNNIGDGKQDGADLDNTNFTNVRDASQAFAGWPIGADDWDLTTANLPTLKVFKGAQPTSTITRASVIQKPLITSIATADDLKAFRTSVNGGGDYTGKTVTLTASFPVTGWDTSIGTFKGTFDGQGHVIDLTGSTSLFTQIGEYGNKAGTVENLGLKATITETANGSIGSIAATNFGTIRQCYAEGSITSTQPGSYAGGIVGTNKGIVKDCYSTVAITVKMGAGGIAQVNRDGGIVQRCYATGAITGGGDKIGGIAGDNTIVGSSITQCIALNASITDATGSASLGRITGMNNSGTLSGNYASPLIVGSWSSGASTKDGTKLTVDNFIGTGSGAIAFDEWQTAIWYFDDASANLPILKGFEDAQPSFTRAQMLPKLTIDNVDELKKFRDAVNGGKTYAGDTVKLTAPITVDAWATGINGFKGTFNGDGYVITMTNATASLFETINKGSTVQNLGVDATINASVKVGGIAATNKGTIQRCYTEGMITSTQGYSSGIADNEGTIEDCYSTASVTITTGGYYAGGIAGGNFNGTILRCYATGAISSPGSAGIVGAGISPNSVLNCIALNESITGTGAHARIANGSATLTTNYASPLIAGEWKNIGANLKDGADLDDSNFIGTGAGQGAFTNWSETVWNFGDTTKLPILQGFKGAQSVKDSTRASVMPKPLTIATADELKKFSEAVKGGKTFEGKTVTLTADITLTGDWTPIGNENKMFAGTFEGGGHCVSGLSVTINGSGDQYGGLFGYIDSKGIVQNLGVKGTVSVTSTNSLAHAGGITGSNNGTIQNCYTDVTVTSSTADTKNSFDCAGGIAGLNNNKISNCYTRGNSTAVMLAGGIAGMNTVAIEQCYATGAIEATHTIKGSAGGIAGYTSVGSYTKWCIALNSSITGAFSGRIAGNDEGAFTADNYASPAIDGTWNHIAADGIDGADLDNDNFIGKGAGEGAFTGWSGDTWDFGDTDKLPALKTIGLTDNKPIAGQGILPARADFMEKIIEISAAIPYAEATHKGKTIRVLANGTFTIATDGASLKKLTIEDGGQVVATKAFTCKELLAPRTLGNRWTAYSSPVKMKAVTKEKTDFYTKTGYANVEEQEWGSLQASFLTTSCPLTSPTLVSVEGADVAVTLTAAPAEGSTSLAIPADIAATTGSALSTGIFVFCQNPTLKEVTIPVAYILSANGERFERTAPAIVKPFQAYMVANAATSNTVLSLRAGSIPTANEPIAPDSDFRLWGSNGQLHLSADTASKVAIYDLSGRLIRSFTLTGEQTLNLGRGIYFVHSNNITYKVSL